MIESPPYPVQEEKQELLNERRKLLKEKGLLKLHLECERNSYYFGKYVLNYNDFAPKPHFEMCRIAQFGFDGTDLYHDIAYQKLPDKFLILMLYSRGTFKTTNIVNQMLFALKDYPWLQYLVTKADKKQSSLIVDEVTSHMETNKTFRARYGDWRPKKGDGPFSGEEVTIQPRLDLIAEGKVRHSKDPTISIAGVLGGVAGGHFDIVEGDDLHNETNYQSKELTLKVINHIHAIMPLINPWGMFRIWCTKWTDWDAYGYAIKDLKANAIFHNCYNEIKIFIDGKLDYHKKADGTSSFPTRFTIKRLEAEREREKMMFNAWQLLDPVPEDSIEFPLKFKQYIETADLPISGMRGMSVDTNYEQKDISDYQVITVGTRDYYGILYILWMEFLKVEPTEFMDRVFELKEMFGVSMISCEDITSGKTFIRDLEEEMRIRDKWMVIQAIKRGRGPGKVGRIRIGLKGAWHNRRIVYVRGWDTSLIDEEMIRFPYPPHMDGLDATCDLLNLPWGPAPFYKEKAKAVASEEFKRVGWKITDEEKRGVFTRGLPTTVWQQQSKNPLIVSRKRTHCNVN